MSFSSILQSILHPREKAGKHSTHQHIGFDPNLGLVCPYCHGTGFRNNSNPITAYSNLTHNKSPKWGIFVAKIPPEEWWYFPRLDISTVQDSHQLSLQYRDGRSRQRYKAMLPREPYRLRFASQRYRQAQYKLYHQLNQ